MKQDEAIKQLSLALDYWNLLANLGSRYNYSDIVFHTGVPFSWARLIHAVESDLEVAKGTTEPIGVKVMGKDG